MFEQNRERNLSMVMDFYEMTMANGYFQDGAGARQAAFDVFYRQNPDGGGFAIFAGLEQIVQYIENLHFSAQDIDFLRAQGMFSAEFLDYLAHFHFSGSIYALNVSIAKNERIVVDQLHKKIYKVGTTGIKTNLYNERDKTHDIFKPAPVGMVPVLYSGSYAFDVTLVHQRSEPLWT